MSKQQLAKNLLVAATMLAMLTPFHVYHAAPAHKPIVKKQNVKQLAKKQARATHQAQQTHGLALNRLVKIAIQSNPDLKAKKLAWQSKIQQFPQAVALNDPKLVYSESINPVETRLGPQDRSLSLTQKIPYPGKLRLKGEAVKKEISMAKIRYDKSIKSLSYDSYTQKPIQHIQIVEATIDYRHKYTDRSKLEALLRTHPDADEIILTRGGLLTDTTIANIALRQDGIWYTPTSPLLPGTTRTRLLETGKLQPRDIHRDTLAHYDGVALMNAMIGFSEMKFIPSSWT